MIIRNPNSSWHGYGVCLCKKHGSLWRGRVVGFYSTANTPIGYAIESMWETGSVQIYPADALKRWEPDVGSGYTPDDYS